MPGKKRAPRNLPKKKGGQRQTEKKGKIFPVRQKKIGEASEGKKKKNPASYEKKKWSRKSRKESLAKMRKELLRKRPG